MPDAGPEKKRTFVQKVYVEQFIIPIRFKSC